MKVNVQPKVKTQPSCAHVVKHMLAHMLMHLHICAPILIHVCIYFHMHTYTCVHKYSSTSFNSRSPRIARLLTTKSDEKGLFTHSSTKPTDP
jgi:hypothetical protein